MNEKKVFNLIHLEFSFRYKLRMFYADLLFLITFIIKILHFLAYRWRIVNQNPDFENYLGQIYPAELEIKNTMESNTSASYLDLLLSIEKDGQLHTSLYDKREYFIFHITNFPFLSSNIPICQPNVFLTQSLYGKQGLDHLMNALF